MSEELIKQASTKLLSWLLGIVAMALIGVGGLVFTFYTDWLADEKAEEIEHYQEKAVMFDSPEQKEEIKDHVVEAPSALEQRMKVIQDANFQKEVLRQLKQLAHIDTLNADQIYQIKQRLEE